MRTTRSAGQPYMTKVDDIVQAPSIRKVGELDKGMIDLARRSGNIESIMAETVYENDVFEFEYGLNSNLIHKPTLQERGKAIAWYAVAKFKDGGFQMKVFGKDDIERSRKKSQAGNSPYSPWATDYNEMAKKTVIRAMFKYLPVSNELMRYSEKDSIVKNNPQEDEGEVFIDIIEQPAIEQEQPQETISLEKEFPEEYKKACQEIKEGTPDRDEKIKQKVSELIDIENSK